MSYEEILSGPVKKASDDVHSWLSEFCDPSSDQFDPDESERHNQAAISYAEEIGLSFDELNMYSSLLAHQSLKALKNGVPIQHLLKGVICSAFFVGHRYAQDKEN